MKPFLVARISREFVPLDKIILFGVSTLQHGGMADLKEAVLYAPPQIKSLPLMSWDDRRIGELIKSSLYILRKGR